jgi:hypothetical protein
VADDLPSSWDDEPWPLEEPDLPPVFRPRNWSDSHADAPQVADLADQAQALVDRGWSMERALVACQQREAWAGGLTSAGVSSIAAQGAAGAVAGSMIGSAIRGAMEEEQRERARQAAADFTASFQKVAEVVGTTMEYLGDALRSMAQTFEALELEEPERPQPMCPTHGVLAKGGFCRRCSARQARRSSR